MTRAEAAQELLKRERARESLLDYTKYIDVPGRPISDDPDEWVFAPVETGLAAHHVLLLKTLEKVILGELPRAMFFLPPGSAKSTYGSVVAPTWGMGKFPGLRIILSSYGSELSKKHGRKARQICKSPKYSAVFETSLSKDTAAADFWKIENGSEYMSSGIMSGNTGNRADGLIVDDPVKGREAADSARIQKKTWEAYQDDLRTRLAPGGWEFIIQTRWSENDISGKLLPEDYDGRTGMIRCRDGRDWYVVCIPAQHLADYPPDPLGRKPGEYLWKEWFTPEHFEGFKKIRRTWLSLFQQRPADDEGLFFKREWFRRYRPGTEPTNLHKYLTSDHAPAGEETSDFNCARVWGISPENNIYMLDGFRVQNHLDEFTDHVVGCHTDGKNFDGLIKRWHPFCWFPEDDNNWKAVAGFVRKQMMREKALCRIEPVTPHGMDKPTKAQPFQAMCAAGQVFIPEGPEGDDTIDNYVKFPAGAHDDEVDNGSIIGRVIDKALPGLVPHEKKNPETQAQEDFSIVFGEKKRGGTNIE